MKAVILALVGLMALAGGAQATTLTSPVGTQVEAGTKVHASGAITLDKTLYPTTNNIECNSTIEGEVSNAGGPSSTVTIALSEVTAVKCGVSNTVVVITPGTLELHAAGGGNSTVKSTGLTITILSHNILGTIHCIYETNATDLGTITGSVVTGGTATLDISGSSIPLVGTAFYCQSPQITGDYKFDSPDELNAESSDLISLTSPAGWFVEAETQIHASNESETVLDGTVKIKCKDMTFQAQAGENTEATAIAGSVTDLAFEECGSSTVTVLKPGYFELHATEGGDGTMTSTGAEITVLTHNILGTVHCIFYTEGTDLGTFIGSPTTGGTATWDIDSVPIPRKETDFGCGSTSELTGSYTFTSPDYLAVD